MAGVKGFFPKRGIETSYGVLYLDFWSDDFYIETEDELKNRLESKQDNEMQFEM